MISSYLRLFFTIFSVPVAVFYFLTCYNNINFHNIYSQQEVLHMKLCDHHLHSGFSDDSETGLTDIAEQAIHLGMRSALQIIMILIIQKTRKAIPFC